VKRLSSPSNYPVSGEILNSSPELSVAMRCLQTAAELFHEDLSESTIQLWKKHLASFRDPEIEWAFEVHMQTEKFFPRPFDISTLVGVWREDHRPKENFKYKPTGWGEPQVLALWELFHKKYPDHKRGERLSDDQWEEMMREVQSRGKVA